MAAWEPVGLADDEHRVAVWRVIGVVSARPRWNRSSARNAVGVSGRSWHDIVHSNRMLIVVSGEETVFVQTGRLLFRVGKDVDERDEFELLPGGAVHLAPGIIHRMTAIEDSVVLEASTTELADVVRLEDRYGRSGG